MHVIFFVTVRKKKQQLYPHYVYYLLLCFHVLGAKYEVEVESGLDDRKALEILALYTKMNQNALPVEARDIVKECKGL